MDVPNVAPRSALTELAALLDSPEIAALVSELEATRWTGRPGYPIRAMLGMALVKSLYAIPTWSRTAALVSEHPALQSILGCAPSVYACYRFATKLRAHSDKLDACIARVLDGLRAEHPDMGWDVSIDASDLPADANGQRFTSKGGRERSDDEFSDPAASWGHRSAVSTRKGGGFYGYKVDMAVCSRTGLPLAWQTRTAKANESNFALPLIDAARERGFNVETAAMDKGYDLTALYEGCEDRGIRPIMPLRLTPAVKAGADEPPKCEHGRWQFAGPTTSARRPSGAARPASASPAPSGSRRVASTPSSPATPNAGASSTSAVVQSSESTD